VKNPVVIRKDSRACDRLFKELQPSYPDYLNILTPNIDGSNYGSGVYAPGMHNLNENDKEWFVTFRKGANGMSPLHPLSCSS
jgi:hypothetical protein